MFAELAGLNKILNSGLLMTITIDFQPVGRKVETDSDTSILKAAQASGIGISAICGGQTSCGRCLIRLIGLYKANSPTAIETKKIAEKEIKAGYRLACQTILIDSAVVEIPPESLTAPQRTQVEGSETKIQPQPAVSCQINELPELNQQDFESDWDYLKKLFENKGISCDDQVPISLLKTLPEKLRGKGKTIKAVLHHKKLVTVLSPDKPVLGVAVDIGTTKIAAYLINLESGKTLAQSGTMNPQVAYGEDIMARIALIIKDSRSLQTLQNAVVNSLNTLLKELCEEANNNRELQSHFKPDQVLEWVVVGNSAMHHIFLGLPVQQLGLAPYVLATSSPVNVPASDIGLIGATESCLHLLPNIAGFVGADHVAMLLGAGINEDNTTTLYIDIGTNTEITLKHPGGMIACSAASGPAFEGAHIINGMRAAEGAIERVRIEDTQIYCQTIGNGKPVGICGSGVLDATAQMVKNNIILKNGRFNEQHPLVNNKKGIVIVPKKQTKHGRDIIITRKDISEIQLAKGAIRTAIELIIKEASIAKEEVACVKIAGAFGSYIDINSAKAIGLLPDFPDCDYSQIGNAAGSGARQALLSVKRRKEAETIAGDMEFLELSNHNEFQSYFARHMSLSQ